MAFTADIITDKLRTMKNAYISAIVRYSDKSKTCIQLNVWETAEARQEFPYIPAFVPPELELPTDLCLQADNPIAYAYQLLEASGQFPDATWNI